MIKRAMQIADKLQKGKVLIVYGPRQVGKTTLVKEFLSHTTQLPYFYATGDDLQIAGEVSKCTAASTTNFVGDYKLLVIDEAQKITNIGRALKLMVDTYPDRYFVATGSSSFDLASQTAEALTGRKNIIELFPISQLELSKQYSSLELRQQLETTLIYGSYPEVVSETSYQKKELAIRQITNSYLLRDILEYSGIKNSNKVLSILKLLAFQLGSEVSTVELGSSVDMDAKTVQKHLDLLEKSFVIYSLGGFSRNLRKEVSKMSKYYFYDNGVRNALISNFNTPEDRDDIGQLWENFVMIERRKKNAYLNQSKNYYFWRTYDQQEIDLIEEAGGTLSGYEIKWRSQRVKPPQLWLDTYGNATYAVIDQEKYIAFVS